MSKKIQRTITQGNLAESRALRTLWDARTPLMSQAEFGEVFEVGTQAAVGQFLNGKAALSLKAAKGFAKGLGCDISDFSTRLAREAAALGEVSGGTSQLDLTSLTRDELRVLLLFRKLDAVKQQRFVEFGSTLLHGAGPATLATRKLSENDSVENADYAGSGTSVTRPSRRIKQKA